MMQKASVASGDRGGLSPCAPLPAFPPETLTSLRHPESGDGFARVPSSRASLALAPSDPLVCEVKRGMASAVFVLFYRREELNRKSGTGKLYRPPWHLRPSRREARGGGQRFAARDSDNFSNT